MKAIQIEAYGNPAEVVQVVDLPDQRTAPSWKGIRRMPLLRKSI
jgi:hypothetical protein